MVLNNVINMPGQQAINKLYTNDLTNQGQAYQGQFNKHELDDLYTHLGNIRQYERDVNLGNTISSYVNWSHVEANDGYSVWKYPVNSFVDNSLNEMYDNDIKLSYLGLAQSESTMLGFNSVQISNSKRSGATYVNHTAEATSGSGTPFTMVSYTNVINETVSAVIGTPINLDYENIINGSVTVTLQTFSAIYTENSDFIMTYGDGTITCLSSGSISNGAQLYVSYKAGSTMYLGLSGVFDSVNLGLSTKGVGNQLTYTYSSGSSNWVPFTPALDSTNNFSNDGNITWNSSELINWTTDTVNGSASMYWIKIQTSQYGMIYPTCYHIVRADSAATKLVAMSQTDLNSTTYKWCYYNGNVYVAIANQGNPVNEGVTFIKSGSNLTKKSNYFVTNNKYKVNYYNTTSGILQIHNSVFVSGNLTVGGNFNISGAVVMSGDFNLNGRVFTANGSSAAPAWTFRTASDTGWFLDSTGKMCATVDRTRVISLSSGIVRLNRNTQVSGTLIVAGTITGTLGTAAQTNITSVGTLTSLTSSGKIETTSTAVDSFKSAGSIQIPSNKYFHFGGATTEGSWRLGLDGDNLVIQRYESAAWVTKTTITK